MTQAVSRRTKLQRQRDKRLNTIFFNRKWKKRRAKARHDEVNRKRNRKCGYGS